MRSFFWLIPVGFVAACVGDSPVESVKPANSETDGGSSDSGTPPVTDGQRAAPTIELTVEPTTVVRGDSGVVVVKVARRIGEAVPVTLKLQGGPAEFGLGGDVVLGIDDQSIGLPFTAGSSSSFGPVTLQVNATASQFEAPVLIDAVVAVRGAPGSLDTSFGAGGIVERASASSDLVDVLMAPNGRMLALFAFGVSSYDADGHLESVGGSDTFYQLPGYGAECTSVDGHSLAHSSDQWFITGFCGANHIVHAAMTTTAPFEVTFPDSGLAAFTAPLGSSAMMAGLKRRANGGYVTASRWDPEYNIRARVKLLEPDGRSAPGWPEAGLQIAPTADIALENTILAAEASNDRVYLLTIEEAASVKHRGVQAFDVATAARVWKSGVDDSVTSMSLIGPDGSVLTSRPARRPCVTHLPPSGDIEVWPSGCQQSTTADERNSQASFMHDGRILVVSAGSPSSFWTLTSTGVAESPLDGITLEGNAQQDQVIVRMFEDIQHRLVLATRWTSTPDVRWVIKRFWL